LQKDTKFAVERCHFIHQDNGFSPHSSCQCQTLEKIEEMGWELLPHLPFSLDLAPSDFHLSGPLKESLAGIKFENDEEDGQQHVRKFLNDTNKDFHATGFSSTSRTMGTLY